MVTYKTNYELWESLLISHSVNLRQDLRRKICFIKVHKSNPEYFAGYMMVLSEPIEIEGGFRLIPNYLDYAVNELGVIKRTISGKEICISNKIKDSYPQIAIKNSRYHYSTRHGVHRLVALAWCDNSDWVNKTIPNHKDGNKYNYTASNLEWVTYSENATHAFEAGLRTDNIRVKIRDIDTGEVKEFYSLGDMSRFIGLSRAVDPVRFEKSPPYTLLLKKYEVRTERDDRHWYYESNKDKVPHSRYITTVTYPDGHQEKYWDNRDIIKKFKCWNVSAGIHPVVEKARALHPDLKFDIVDRWKDRIVETIKVDTMEIVDTSPWVRNAMKFMKCSKGTVTRLLRLEEQRPLNGYAVRYKTDKPWNILPENYIGKRMRVQVTNIETGSSTIYESLREIERELSISRFKSKLAIFTGADCDGYTFKKIDE